MSIFIGDSFSTEEIAAIAGGSTLGGSILCIVVKLFLQALKIWKKCKEDKKTTGEAITIILKNVRLSGNKTNKSKKSKKK